MVDQAASVEQADNGALTFSNSVLNCPNANFYVKEDGSDAWSTNTTSGLTLEDWFLSQEGNAVGEAAVNSISETEPDYLPSSTGSATATDVSSLLPEFDAGNYIGAVDATDWTIGWTTHDVN